MSPSDHFFETPPENLRAVSAMVHDSYQREVARRTIIAKAAAVVAIDLPDFAADAQVHIDVVTLDSSSCAPCQYMMDAVHRAVRQFSHPVQVREHRITTREGLQAMSQLGVENIPTICIDGRVVFASLIPDQRTLTSQLEEVWRAKQDRLSGAGLVSGVSGVSEAAAKGRVAGQNPPAA